MIKMSRKAKKAMAVALTAGMLASTAVTPVMAATQGWKQNSKGWWYQNADGSYPANKWSQINGKWYYFDANGYMLANKWVKDSAGKWYYVGKSGAMLTNAWIQGKDGLWYWVTDNGSMKDNGWGKINGEWYFFKNDGVMQSGVVKVDGKVYYLGLPSEGWMHTGVVTIEGAEYNFDETNGDCTSQKAPATTKYFDKKGNPIENKIEVEEVDGISAEVVNALPQYKDYGSVVMAGSNVTIKVKVSNNGEPVVGTFVTLSLKRENALPYEGNDYTTDSYVAQTGVGGYATFVVHPKYDTITPTTGRAEYYTYKITSATNDAEVKEGNFAIGILSVPPIDVNPTGADDKLEMSDNAVAGQSSEVVTTGMDGVTKITFVKSQQVSLPNQTDHKVTFEINPEIHIPTGKINKVTSDYQKDVNQSISEYSVYEEQEFWIEDIPAGLQYATLNFENIDISEHTKVEIQAYENDDRTKTVGEKVTITGPSTQKSLGQQIPILQEKEVAIKVKVISAGQVNDGQNGGLTIKDVVGVYKQEGTVEVTKLPLTNPVTWEQSKIEYSLSKDLNHADACYYIADDTYQSPNYKYSYQVPVFPFVGNAIITVKDSNNQVLAYFTVPTVNQPDATTSTKYKNVNILDGRAYQSAILVTKDEAFNNVGTITPNGNRVTVNSSETGITAFKAKINIDGEEFDLTNNTINTSVQWSPIPSVAQENDFYALSGQSIVVKAQLVDKAGNKVSKSNEPITFSYSEGNLSEGKIGDTLVTAMDVASITDSEGCAKLVVQATDEQALLQSLSADSTNRNYDVILQIGDEKVETANLRWVTPGLTFKPTALDIKDLVLDDPKNPTDTLNTLDENFDGEVSKEYAERYLSKEAGSNWILGFNANGETQDDLDAGKVRWVSSIQGLKINISQDGDATLVTEGMKNGAAKISTTKANGIKLTGEIDETSVVAGTPITFDVYTKVGTADATHKVYTNVGEGTPVFDEEVALTLPVLFGNVGTQMSIELPKGDSIANAAGAGDDVTETVHVKVADSFKNPIIGKQLSKVTITYTYIDGNDNNKVKTKTEDVTPAEKTNSYGVVDVDIKANNLTTDDEKEIVTKAEIKAEYDNQSTKATISFVEPKGIDFLLLNANYDADKKQATLTFSQNVSNLKDNMITVIADNGVSAPKSVAISKVEVKDGNQVVVTFKNDLKDDYEYTIHVVTSSEDADVDDDGITDFLCDKYGRELVNNDVIFTKEPALFVPTYDKGTFTISFKINNEAATTEAIICVWDDGYSILPDGELEVNDLNNDDNSTSNDIIDPNITEVKCYYNGNVKTVKLSDHIEAIEQAKTDIAAASFAIASDYASVSKVDLDSLFSGYDVKKVTITDAKGIFKAYNNDSKLVYADTKVKTIGATAIVKVTYVDKTYTSATKTVTYKVTLSDSTEVGTEADTITFTVQ